MHAFVNDHLRATSINRRADLELWLRQLRAAANEKLFMSSTELSSCISSSNNIRDKSSSGSKSASKPGSMAICDSLLDTMLMS